MTYCEKKAESSVSYACNYLTQINSKLNKSVSCAAGKAYQDVVLAHDLVKECVAGAKVCGEDCILVSRAAALDLQPFDSTS